MANSPTSRAGLAPPIPKVPRNSSDHVNGFSGHFGKRAEFDEPRKDLDPDPPFDVEDPQEDEIAQDQGRLGGHDLLHHVVDLAAEDQRDEGGEEDGVAEVADRPPFRFDPLLQHRSGHGLPPVRDAVGGRVPSHFMDDLGRKSGFADDLLHGSEQFRPPLNLLQDLAVQPRPGGHLRERLPVLPLGERMGQRPPAAGVAVALRVLRHLPDHLHRQSRVALDILDPSETAGVLRHLLHQPGRKPRFGHDFFLGKVGRGKRPRQVPQKSRQQGDRRIGGQVGPDGAEVDHQEDAGPEARARRQSEKAGEHGLAAIQGVAHHLQVVAALEEDAHGGDPHEYPAVLRRQGGTGQPLPSSDSQPHHEQARPQEPAQIEAVRGRSGKRVHSPGRHFPGRNAEVGAGIGAGHLSWVLVGHLAPWRRRVSLRS